MKLKNKTKEAWLYYRDFRAIHHYYPRRYALRMVRRFWGQF